MQSDFVQEQLKSRASGTTVTGIRQSELRRIVLEFPPLAQQRTIARILSALDDKIELNRRTNETLEAMARALFQSWFVDFDPVTACAGRLPPGWRRCTLGTVLEWSRTQVDPGATPDVLYEHYSLPAFDANRRPTLDRGSQIKSNKFAVPSGSVLFSKLNPGVPRVWIPFAPTARPQVSSTEFIVAVPKSVPRSILYLWLLHPTTRHWIVGKATGTSPSHQRVRPQDVEAVEIALPGQETMSSFDRALAPMLAQQMRNLVENASLAELRDALLPKLLSGELRVPDAERAVSALL